MEKRPVAYQLYSAREDCAKDLNAVLAELKRLGYDGVEFAGFYGHTAQEVKTLLDANGLIAISDHVPLALIEENPYGVIADHLYIGCKYIAVPYMDDEHRPGAKGFAHSLQVINRFARLCKEAGIQLLYHNHDFEFVQLSGMYALDFLYESIPACLLKTELDVCWVKYAGENPADYIRKYAGRCPVVHLKDYVGKKAEDGGTPYALIGIDDGEKKETQAFEFRPFGYGCQDVNAVLEAGIKSGAEWFIIEQDMSIGRTPLEAAALSMDTLRKAGLK